ncbi:hypothetical protein LCGC14_0620730 [marine sediment metagenome]|uniref:Uncharacterized protein n=1 Tax=marine sediment metagenome TaxID=412755 RepID=A0A0F9R9U9_9ZZZZ
MKRKEKLKCPVCTKKFIPRTFYPEEAMFSTSDGKKLSGFNGYINSSGVKPVEVILSSWITYCPYCNYMLKFVKEIVKKERIQSQSVLIKDITKKYNNYYFGFPFEDYSQYLSSVTVEIKSKIETSLIDLDLTTFENIYEIKDTFKLLIKFYANLEKYCNSQLHEETDRNLAHKIKLLKLPKDLEQILLELNEIRNKSINSDYELSEEDKTKVKGAINGFIFSLIEKHLKPIIDGKKLKTKYQYLDIRDLIAEIKIYLKNYFSIKFKTGRTADNEIISFLEQIMIN